MSSSPSLSEVTEFSELSAESGPRHTAPNPSADVSLPAKAGAADERKRRERASRRWQCLTPGCVHNNTPITPETILKPSRTQRLCPGCKKSSLRTIQPGGVSPLASTEDPVRPPTEDEVYFCSNHLCEWHIDHTPIVPAELTRTTAGEKICPGCGDTNIRPESCETSPLSRREQTRDYRVFAPTLSKDEANARLPVSSGTSE